MAFYSARWYRDTYGDLGFDSILFTLTANLNGVENDLIFSWMGSVLPVTLLFTALAVFLCALRSKKQIFLRIMDKWKQPLFPLRRTAAAILCLALSAGLLARAAVVSDLSNYISNMLSLSRVFEEEYRDPKTANITFPEEKRNLIYIFMESMETTYLSKEQGGAIDNDLIPELYQLAQQNINFSHSEDVGGFGIVGGDNWTIGAMVSQTAGVPLKTPPGLDNNGYGEDGTFLPGLYNLTSVLKDNGYYQTLMVGSESAFGGRKAYYEQHGADRIYDVFTAMEDGLIPEDRWVWWGYEDLNLYAYAKQELTKIAAGEQPFAFTMLTVDTHHIGGYICDLCENTYAEQYENVIACASRQVAEFIDWLKQQDFYENTTIVIAGDHPSMDSGYFNRIALEDGYVRRVYNCFINADAQAVNTKNRFFCAFDMFPSTLAAMGCTIESDRLGLGTNLFSQTPTLLEETNGQIAAEIAKNSHYYTDRFFFS